MAFQLRFTRTAQEDLARLQQSTSDEIRPRKVRKALGQLQRDPLYPALRSHKYTSLHGVHGEEVFDSYVENNTPSAWRIFSHYGPGRDTITVLHITPHP